MSLLPDVLEARDHLFTSLSDRQSVLIRHRNKEAVASQSTFVIPSFLVVWSFLFRIDSRCYAVWISALDSDFVER